MMRQLLDIVYQAVQVPLRVHLALGAQRKPIQPFVVTQVGEHRLDDGDAPPIEPAAPVTVDRPLHALGVGQWRGLVLRKESHLPRRGSLGVAKAALSQMAGQAVAFGALEPVMRAPLGRAGAAAHKHGSL